MRNKYCLLLIALFAWSSTFAQYGETIRSGRPGQAIGPFTAGARVLQVQYGINYGQAGYHSLRDRFKQSRHFGSDIVVRVGITERFEMSVATAYLNEKMSRDSVIDLNEGIGSFSVRARSNIYVGEGARPTVGFQVGLSLPVISFDFRPKQVAPKLTVMTGQRFGKRWGLTTNWGVSWDGINEYPIAFYVVNLGFDISSKVSTFIEHYASMDKFNWLGSVDGGFAYLATPDLQLDVLGGYGPLRMNDDWFVSLGVSWRIRFKERVKKEKS